MIKKIKDRLIKMKKDGKTISHILGFLGGKIDNIIDHLNNPKPNKYECPGNFSEIRCSYFCEDYSKCKSKQEPPEEKITLACPTCNGKKTVREFDDNSDLWYDEMCIDCEGVGIQMIGLSKKQAKLALDEGFVIIPCWTDKDIFYVKHNDEYLYYGGDKKYVVSSAFYNEGKDETTFSIKCRAVETHENLSNSEALKYLIDGWQIYLSNRDKSLTYYWQIENNELNYYQDGKPFKNIDNETGMFMMDLGDKWIATKRNYPLPKEEK